MKENVNDYLRNKIGVKTVERLKVMEAIFGEEGILNAEDSYQFEQRSAAASTLMVPLSNEFLQYFNKTILSEVCFLMQENWSYKTWVIQCIFSHHSVTFIYKRCNIEAT
jgi:hypothetical protein